MGHIVQTGDCIQIPINRILSRNGSVTDILGIFTVVSKKGDGFCLGPRNVKLVLVCKKGKSQGFIIVSQYFIICDKCLALYVPVGNVGRVTTIYQHLKM